MQFRLNEGFASWVEYLGYNYTHPEWRDVNRNLYLIFLYIIYLRYLPKKLSYNDKTLDCNITPYNTVLRCKAYKNNKINKNSNIASYHLFIC